MNRTAFGTVEGREAQLYSFSNANGMEMTVCDYGAHLVSVKVPAGDGSRKDMVLGYDDAAGYVTDPCHLGATIGRNGNRIANAAFELNGVRYQLAANENGNSLHSGPDGYEYRFWEVKEVKDQAITLHLDSPDKDQGFPGNFSVGYFLLAVWYLDSHGDGAMLYRYANFSTDGGSLTDIVKACLVNPGYVFSQCLDEDKMVFFLQMMLPLGFLPLFCTRISSYILLGPFMLINLMSYYPYQHSLDYQYNFGVTALLFYLTIVNLSARKQQTRRFLALLCAAFAVFGFSAFVGERLGYISYYQNTKEVCDTLDEVVAQVPKDASVYSSTFLLPHLYQNKILYQLNADSPDLSGRTEYVLIDLRFQEFSDLYPLYVQAGFQTVVYEEGAAALLYCPFYEAAEP